MPIDNGEPFDLFSEIPRIVATDAFGAWAQAAAMKMVTNLFSDSGRTWRQAARHNSGGRMIYEAMQRELEGPVGIRVQELIERNATLIKSLPADVAHDVTEYIRLEAMKGKRWDEIAASLPDIYGDQIANKAALIARTETSKVHTALIQARAENIGVDWYVWRTSKDSRVRNSHAHMEGVLINWRDPPSPEALAGMEYVGTYHAGEIWNCRCFPQPLYDVDLISWPHKVYYRGDLVIMTQSGFSRIAA